MFIFISTRIAGEPFNASLSVIHVCDTHCKKDCVSDRFKLFQLRIRKEMQEN